jgi:D-alanyl-D-alanine endopeptidase (penicillin-binding protein 7)
MKILMQVVDLAPYSCLNSSMAAFPPAPARLAQGAKKRWGNDLKKNAMPVVVWIAVACAIALPARSEVQGLAKSATQPVKRRAESALQPVRKQAPLRLIAAVKRPENPQLVAAHGASAGPLLKSNVALVVDQDTNEVLFSKNESAVLPIASITKLMTGLLISEANLPMDEGITITQADVDMEKGSTSRLRVGTELSRGELLHLALMASENRAAHALGRTYPGGLEEFVSLMNAKARMLGMNDTSYVEPTGLSSHNQSSAKDLATLVNVAYGDPTLRELSTSTGYQVAVGHRTLQYNNTNRLVKNPSWDIGLQKTGYISEAGQCLVMQARVAGRKIIMVLLDSAGKLTRLADAERVKRWIESIPVPLSSARASPLASKDQDRQVLSN